MLETTSALRTRTLYLPGVGTGGSLSLPKEARGIVLFAHGSGSSRFSPRNTYVASALQEAGLATFLFDLLTEEEAADRAKVFNIPLLAERLLVASEVVRQDSEARGLAVGYFGASTGAGAALVAAARASFPVAAVVSRGGRPDLAGAALDQVQAPTLLIVGGRDCEVLSLNEVALARLRCEKDLKVIPGATHLFEELGTLDRVIALARNWFRDHLAQQEQG
jgi:predicted alpha/beta-hydrolase family hydrolase